jgi:penicillin-binding protein 1C
VPSDACDHRVKVLAPLHAVPTAPCPYHQAYEVDRETARAVLPACRLADHVYDRKSFVVLPSSVNAWLAERHRAIPERPVFAEACTAEALVGTTAGAPTMIAPSEGQIVTLIPGVPANHQSVALAVATRAASVSWFVDGELVGTAPASERLYWAPTPGIHDVLVADDAGRKARRKLDVRLEPHAR